MARLNHAERRRDARAVCDLVERAKNRGGGRRAEWRAAAVQSAEGYFGKEGVQRPRAAARRRGARCRHGPDSRGLLRRTAPRRRVGNAERRARRRRTQSRDRAARRGFFHRGGLSPIDHAAVRESCADAGRAAFTRGVAGKNDDRGRPRRGPHRERTGRGAADAHQLRRARADVGRAVPAVSISGGREDDQPRQILPRAL